MEGQGGPRDAPRNHVCAVVRCATVPRDVVDANNRDELAVLVREARGGGRSDIVGDGRSDLGKIKLPSGLTEWSDRVVVGIRRWPLEDASSEVAIPASMSKRYLG